MKKYILIIFFLALTLASTPVTARGQDKSSVDVSLMAGPDVKMLYPSMNMGPASIGYTSSLDIKWKNIVLGVGFDNGIKSSSMEFYNFYLSAKAGYEKTIGKAAITPFVRAGRFFDISPTGSCEETVTDIFLGCAGMEFSYEIIENFGFFLSAQALFKEVGQIGASLSAGIKVTFKK